MVDMKASKDIKTADTSEELRVCPSCEYDLGFHVSLLRENGEHNVILICPNCGVRYSVGWKINLDA